jgi:hypothetical protein
MAKVSMDDVVKSFFAKQALKEKVEHDARWSAVGLSMRKDYATEQKMYDDIDRIKFYIKQSFPLGDQKFLAATEKPDGWTVEKTKANIARRKELLDSVHENFMLCIKFAFPKE